MSIMAMHKEYGLVGALVGKDMYSKTALRMQEPSPMIKARNEIMLNLSNELVPKVTTKGECVLGMHAWTSPKV